MIKELLNKSNLVTFIGLISSIIGIKMCYLNKIDISIICLIISGICDAFDGTIAKKIRKNSNNNFGVELDSLVDIVSSGIFPILICIAMNFNSTIDTVIYAIFIITSVTRLAYYNINNQEDNEHFTGVPITVSTIIIPVLYFLEVPEVVFVGSIFILSLLYITPIKIKKINLSTKILLAILGIIFILYKIGEVL